MRRSVVALTLLLVLAAPARAEAPAAVTGDATAITSTGATLGGTVDLKGAASGQARFVYGPNLTPEQTVTANGPVSAGLTGLAPNTTYNWRVRVKTTEQIDGEVKQFTTLPEAPTAQTGDATEISQTSARLAGVADTKGVQGQVSIVLDGSPIGETTRFGGPYSTVATGLTAGSTHTYRLRVVTTGGTALGEERSFTTLAAGATPTPTADPSPTPTATSEPTATPSPGPVATITPELGVRFTVTKRRISAARKRVIAFVRCTGLGCDARVTGSVKRFGRLLTIRAKHLPAGRRVRLRIKVPERVKRYLQAHPSGHVTLRLRAAFTGDDGTRRTRTVRVRIRS